MKNEKLFDISFLKHIKNFISLKKIKRILHWDSDYEKHESYCFNC